MAEQPPAAEDGGTQVVTALYVGDLDPTVTDEVLSEVFKQMGDVLSVKVCMDQSDVTAQRSLGYGYVNYRNPQDAARALKELNFTKINGKSIRIAYSNRDPDSRKSSAANIFVKNLDKAIDNKVLYDIFSAFGNIVSSKVETGSSGESKGYGFVQYDSEEAAQKAIEQNGMSLYGREIYITHFMSKQERDKNAKFTNVFVKNLSESTTEEDLTEVFGEFGLITSVVVMRDEVGNSKCFGFVNFENTDDAVKCVESLNGAKFDDKEWYVGRALKKFERERELKLQRQQTQNEARERVSALNNLYIKNLDDSITDDKIKELFSQFGVVTSCKVNRNEKGISKGSGFVSFSTQEEASKAISEMNKKMVGRKPLYVAIAEKKEDRTARLQAHFAQLQLGSSSVAPQMAMYPPTSPRPRPQMYYGQPGPSYFSPMFIRPGGPFMPNVMLPLVQPGPRPVSYGRRPVVDPVQPFATMQPQLISRARAPGYPLPNVSTQGSVLRGPQPRDVQISPRAPIQSLASALANAPPSQHRMMLGDNLYPLVQQLEPESAGKVTGMLLEMDQTEVLHLIESPDALRAKVAEAMMVLRNAPQREVDEQLASYALNE